MLTFAPPSYLMDKVIVLWLLYSGYHSVWALLLYTVI